MEMNLKNKTDDCLVLDLKGLVARERDTLTRILHYLREVETRRLYLIRGFPSLFAWMMAELGYSEASAQRRISAMRLIKEIPEVEENIKKGEVSLSVVSQIQSYFRKEDKKRRESQDKPLPMEAKLNLLDQLKGSSARECEKKLIKLNPELNIPREKTRPLTEEKTLIQFTAGKELMGKIELLKQLISHQNPEGKYDKLFEKAVDLALERLDPARRQARREKQKKILGHNAIVPGLGPIKVSGRGAQLQKNASSLPTSKAIAVMGTLKVPKEFRPAGSRSRHIPQTLRDKIWLRDKGQCQFRDSKTDKPCKSSHALEIDHKYPFAFGGKNNEANLRLVCRSHNQYRAQRLFER